MSFLLRTFTLSRKVKCFDIRIMVRKKLAWDDAQAALGLSDIEH